ncbi:MAG: hypothetical protein ACT4TC_13415 [Myxococcaceae bacterium]
MVLTQLLCAALLSTAPVEKEPAAQAAESSARAPNDFHHPDWLLKSQSAAPMAQTVRADPYKPSALYPVAEALGGIVGGFLGSLISTFPALLIAPGQARDTYSLVAWTLAAPLTSSAAVYWAGGLSRQRERSYSWALTGALGGEAVAAGVFFALGGVDRVRTATGVGPSFWPLVLAPIASALGATLVMELTARAKPVAEVALAPMVVPFRNGYAQGFQLAARY